MKDYSFLERMKDEDASLFKKCIRKLLDNTFIIEDRDEKLYQYVSAESNHNYVSEYLKLIGYDVIVEDKLKVAMLIQNEEDLETVGIRKSNLKRFDNKQRHMLLVLWLLYLEKFGYSEEVYATVGDISDKLKVYGIDIKPTEFKDAFQIFKRFSLINFVQDERTDENANVRLYPTLQFCMSIEQLKQVMMEYLPEDEFELQSSETEDSEYTDDDEYDEDDE